MHYWSAGRMARAIAEGEVSAVEALEHCMERVERFDVGLNAVCVRVDERARTRARAADAARARGQSWGPLHGVPMTVKEGYDLAGTPTTWGFPEHTDNVPASDAEVVRRLTGAGAVVYGKTNVPVGLMDWQSENPVYGRTNNPWDTTRTPGGSSGGAAAALAVGYTFLEAGSDIGGSLRNPAHFCGVCALKPTYGVVPVEGHTLHDEPMPADIAVCGPMARSAEDLVTALDVMAGAHGPAATAWRLELPPPRHTALEDFRIATVRDDPVCPVAAEVRQAITAVSDACEAAGAQVDRDVELPVDSQRVHRLFIQLQRATLSAGLDDDAYEEELVRRAAFDGGDARAPGSYRAQITHALTQSYREWHLGAHERVRMQRAWAAFFERYDALLAPAAPTVAWPHDAADRFDRIIEVDDRVISYFDELYWAGFTGLVHLPSAVVPAPRPAGALPIGVQIVAPHLEDRTALALAVLIERQTGGFVPPPDYP